jgi:hypothetical protein
MVKVELSELMLVTFLMSGFPKFLGFLKFNGLPHGFLIVIILFPLISSALMIG